MATINHYDEHTGRYLQLKVDDEQIAKERSRAQAGERHALRRAQVLRRCLRLLDSGVATPEHVLGEAFNAGHTIGSGVADFTRLESDVIDCLALITFNAFEESVLPAGLSPEFKDFLQAVRKLKECTKYEY